MPNTKIAIKPLYIILAVVVVAALLAAIYFETGSSGAAQVVAVGDNISVYYTGTLTNGTQFGSNFGGQPLQFTVGSNQVITGFDQGVIGMKLNETKTITVPANEAYGPVNPEMILNVSLSQFGNQSVYNGMLVTETSGGQQFRGDVIAVNATTAKVDFNSPLAGQTLIFTIKVIGISK